MGSDRARDESPTSAEILDRLFDVIVERRTARPDGSYVVGLLDAGVAAVAAKVDEEAREVVDAARDESDDAVAHEAADLLFHLWVLLASRGLAPADVYRVLERRFGIGGLEEKAARGAAGDGLAGREEGGEA